MTRRQFLTIILVNALVSLVIAVAVVLIALNLGVEQSLIAPTPYVILPPTPTPVPPSTPTTLTTPSPTLPTEGYVVEPGDTLLGIAVRLDVDPQLLMALNDISDADRLLVGQSLRVPLGSVPATATAPVIEPAAVVTITTAAPITATVAVTVSTGVTLAAPLTGTIPITATEALTAAAIPGEPMITAVLAPGELAEEAVRLVNIGQTPVRLRNWSLRRPDGRRYVFPDATLEPSSALLIYSRQGADTETALFWGLQQATWQAGDLVILADQAGQTVGSLTVGE
jgi:hypothetical protein